MTEAEQNAAWDEKFYGSLGEFDKRLSREQAEIEKQRSASAGQGSGSGKQAGEEVEGGAGGTTGMPQEVAGSETGSSDGAAGASGQGGPGGSPGQPGSGPKFPAPEGIPTGVDDDVVARQLREAAETEKDPELRARLWDEYRKYKSRK